MKNRVNGIIVDSKGKLLLVKNGKIWDLPGCILEKGGRKSSSLRTFLKEKFPFWKTRVSTFFSSIKIKEDEWFYFFIESEENMLLNEDSSYVKFYSLSETKSLNLSKATTHIIRKLHQEGYF